jgi:exodeoxyribonuclease VII large subunit
VVSAIGHETDTPLLDYVADLRASTPTDAAKRIVPDLAEERQLIETGRRRLDRGVLTLLDREQHRLDAWRSRPSLARPELLVDQRAADVTALRDRAVRSLEQRLRRADDELRHTVARLRALSPAATLQRGYAIVQRDDGHVVRAATEVAADDLVRVRLAEGELRAVVRETE